MYVYLSKLLPLLLMPLTISLVVGASSLIMLALGRNRIAHALFILSLGSLWIGSTPAVASKLYKNLESAYPPASLESIPDSACLILLGGAVGPPAGQRVDIELFEGVDRLYKSVALFESRKVEKIVVSAGNQPWDVVNPTEAELIADLLTQWGVPASAVITEGNSRNTRENALYSVPILQELKCERPLLVTSAAHMHRALASFRVLGVDAIPVSTDVRVVEKASLDVIDFLPSADALAMTSDAVREWMGQKVYEWKGWN